MPRETLANVPAAEPAMAPATSRVKAPAKAGHYVALDAVRGYAAFAVAIYHILQLFHVPGGIPGSFLAVDLFFLMSGFVVAYSYEKRLLDGSMSFWRFAQVRTIRLYPLYAVSLGLGLFYFTVKIVLGQPDAPAPVDMLAAGAQSVVMLPVVAVNDPGLMNYPFSPSAWSLVLEFWFNLAFALLIVRWSNRALMVVAGVSFIVLVQQAMAHGTADLGWGVATLLGGSVRFWFSFTVGVLLFRMRGAATPLPSIALLLVSPALLFLLVPHDAIFFQLFWIAVVFPVFIAIAARIPVGGVAATVSDHLGRLSYAVYILHGPVILLMLGVLTVFMGRAWEAFPLESAIYLLIGLGAISVLATYVFDEPVRRWLRVRGRSTKS